jgi:hypothetical protein
MAAATTMIFRISMRRVIATLPFFMMRGSLGASHPTLGLLDQSSPRTMPRWVTSTHLWVVSTHLSLAGCRIWRSVNLGGAGGDSGDISESVDGSASVQFCAFSAQFCAPRSFLTVPSEQFNSLARVRLPAAHPLFRGRHTSLTPAIY